ncbi:MAG TPA: hypothetical protein VKM55_09445 [Candidatus Lokiarchaeia archaeon]|nr:hypothetical protein [Candidatus Lokiarchaeia archaeon]
MPKEDIHVIIVGSRNAGISSFINQHAHDYEMTEEAGMGIDIQSTSVFVNDAEYNIIFYEIAGTFPLDSLKKIFQKKFVAFAVMFDLSNSVSLEFAEMITNQVQEKLGAKMPRIKFALASHLDCERAVSQDLIDSLLSNMGGQSYYYEFSSTTGENLSDTMEQLAKKILENPQ